MSDTILRIIPGEPSFTPPKSQQEIAKTFLAGLYSKSQIEFVSTETVEFVDPGENFDSVSCNLCKRKIEIEDWQNAMTKASENQFVDLTFGTSCCNKKASLNDLIYKWPAGFAKFMIEVSEAEFEIPEKDLVELQRILGTRLRIIWARY